MTSRHEQADQDRAPDVASTGRCGKTERSAGEGSNRSMALTPPDMGHGTVTGHVVSGHKGRAGFLATL